MLTAYGDEPLAFTATVAEREPLPLEWREARVQPDPGAEQMVMGAFVKGQLVGVAGLRLRRRPRTRHKAILYGMFVLPEFRNTSDRVKLAGHTSLPVLQLHDIRD